MAAFTNDKTVFWVVALVVVAVLVGAAHWPALSSESLSFDDEQYLLENRLVQNPGWKSAGRFLTEVLYPSTVRGYYQPLTMISLMLDYKMGGRPENLRVFRVTSLTLHISNTVLIIVLLYLLFGNFWSAAMIGLLFGVHPLTIESIPWLSERKTLLAGFFSLWSLIFYVCYCRSGKRGSYAICMALFVLALMSKPTSTPVPLLMLLLDYWPLKRLSKKAIVEKIPFLTISVVAAIITFLSQKNTSAVTMPGEHGLLHIPFIICHNIIFYLHKFFWPIRLSAFYPFPKPFTIEHPMVFAGVIGTCILIFALVVSLRWTRALVTGWLFFFLAIFPTLGVIGFHPVIAADRHAYLPMVGFLLPAAGFLAWLFHRWGAGLSRRHIIVLLTVLLVGGAEAAVSRSYLAHWRDTVTHYKYMLSMSSGHAVLYNNLALALKKSNKTDEAIEYYKMSLELKSNSYEVYNNLGNVFLKKGEIDKAIEHYWKAIELTENRRLRRNRPFGFGEAHYNLANALKIQGRFDEAIGHYMKALEHKPNDADAHHGLGVCLAELNRFNEAITCYRKSLELKPGFDQAHYGLGVALSRRGELEQAIWHFRQVLKIHPKDAEMHCNLGVLLTRKGCVDEAIEEFRTALRFDPNLERASERLESALAKKAEPDS